MTATVPLVALRDGRSIPQLGLGVYKIPDDAEAARVVEDAIAAGYRHLDTAALYDNERGVGEGLRASGIPRDEVFVTTKLWNDRHGFDDALRAFDESLERLDLDFVDLYLIHWPCPRQDRYVEAWRALERIHESGRARSIGVSNFHAHHIDRLIEETGVVPVVDQVELHPNVPQEALRASNAARGIVTEAWSPLARGRLLDDPVLAGIAAKHGRSVSQVVLRWHLQQGVVVIPKTTRAERMRENLDVFGFELDADDLARIRTLENGSRTGRDPDLFG